MIMNNSPGLVNVYYLHYVYIQDSASYGIQTLINPVIVIILIKEVYGSDWHSIKLKGCHH